VDGFAECLMQFNSRFQAPVFRSSQCLSSWVITAAIALLASQGALASPVTNKGDKPVKPAGVEVKVTSEMTGAGIVSSGAVLPPIPPVTGNRLTPVPSWGKPLPYPIIIADRRNNRLIEVAPDKSIVWEFPLAQPQGLPGQ
jgi:hypothetical protein